MKNLKSTIKNNQGFGSTTYIQKAFTTLTEKGNEVVITITRRIINVTSEPFVSGYEYSVSYNGNSIAEMMSRKDELEYYLGFIDKYAGTRFLK